MAHQGPPADEYAGWSVSSLDFHIKVGEQALSKAQAAGDEDRIDVIQRVLEAQKEALSRKDRGKPEAAPAKRKSVNILDLIEEQFKKIDVEDDLTEREDPRPIPEKRSDYGNGGHDPEVERRTDTRSRPERRVPPPREDDADHGPSSTSPRRTTARKSEETDSKTRKSHERRRPDMQRSGRRQRRTRDTESPARSNASSSVDREDVMPSLEKTGGGTSYLRRPPAQFAREEPGTFPAQEAEQRPPRGFFSDKGSETGESSSSRRRRRQRRERSREGRERPRERHERSRERHRRSRERYERSRERQSAGSRASSPSRPRSSREKMKEKEKEWDPFENFPPHIRPQFNMRYQE